MILFKIVCGIDRHKYAFTYRKDLPKKPIISSGVIQGRRYTSYDRDDEDVT